MRKRWMLGLAWISLAGCLGGVVIGTPVPPPIGTPTLAPIPTATGTPTPVPIPTVTGTPTPVPTPTATGTPTPRPRAALYNFVLPG